MKTSRGEDKKQPKHIENENTLSEQGENSKEFKPSTRLQKELLEQLFQGGFTESSGFLENSKSLYTLNQEKSIRKDGSSQGFNRLEGSLLDVKKNEERSEKGSFVNLGRIGGKLQEKLTLRKKAKDSVAIQQLCAMFPSLEPVSVSAAFAAHGGNKQLTADYLERALRRQNLESRHFEEKSDMVGFSASSESEVDNRNAKVPVVSRKAQVESDLLSSNTLRTLDAPKYVETSSKKQTVPTAIPVEQTEVSDSSISIPAENTAFSRRRNSDKIRATIVSANDIHNHSRETPQEYSVPVGRTQFNQTSPSYQVKKSSLKNAETRLTDDDRALLNHMPKNAKQVFRKHTNKLMNKEEPVFAIHPQNTYSSSTKEEKEEGLKSQIPRILTVDESVDNQRGINGLALEGMEKTGGSFSSRVLDPLDISEQDKETPPLLSSAYRGCLRIDKIRDNLDEKLEQSESNMLSNMVKELNEQLGEYERRHFQSLEVISKRILELQEDLQKLDSETSSHILRLDRRYDNIRQLLDDFYARIHQVEYQMDQFSLKHGNCSQSSSRPNSYLIYSLWLLLDGLGFVLWFCLLKPIVFIYGLFCYGKRRRPQHRPRDSSQFGSGDLTKTLAFLMNQGDKDV
eukprot:jgi/Galph1/462/GphlegSOOS_G5211.1